MKNSKQNMKQIDLWNYVRGLYPPRVAELVSVSNILLLCVSGFSITEIADRYDFDESYVRWICNKYLGFEGWKENLGFSPWYYYNKKLEFYDNSKYPTDGSSDEL